jgi:hypothetical protein
LSVHELDAITVEAMVGTVVLDWRGITKGGEPFPYNEENAKWFLTRSSELRDFLFAEANNILNFQDHRPEETVSSPLADTKSSPEVLAGAGQRPASTEGHGGSGNGSPSAPESA